MLRLGAIVLNTSDTSRGAAFWSAALGWEAGANPDFLAPVDGGEATHLHLDRSDRTHLDLWVDSAAEQEAEVERLVGLGATRPAWDYPDGADFVVLADPDGTLFCVVDQSA
ncbi:VOC family protein [Nocardioides flavescens]|uniref:VOC family protein n=1 Tax=Nocardioides flavescens TaxID=2691959 RepID=A0A6L7F305_9ACTN|nr:VOC family protein [Nocardioides flavescens]MXG90604.1 VOC family protein [Nocardioides flavescens]